MKVRWLLLFTQHLRFWAGVILFALLAALTTTVFASNTTQSASSRSTLLRRCENNYSDEELADIYANGDDGYEPDDCTLLSHTLTGPELHNFCQAGDEDWDSFKAKANQIYQIKAVPQWNYPTEPRLELIDDGSIIAQNDHYFGNDAEIWWWNNGPDRRVYLRVTEMGGRHECGNSEYTLSLKAYDDKP